MHKGYHAYVHHLNAERNVRCFHTVFVYFARSPQWKETISFNTNNTGQQILKKSVYVMNMLLICLFASMKLEKEHKKIAWL